MPLVDAKSRRVTVPRLMKMSTPSGVAHCVRSTRAWGAAKFLHQDFVQWSEQFGQWPISAGQFDGTLGEFFRREGDGWAGLCLTVDWAATKGLGSKPFYPLPLATERIQ